MRCTNNCTEASRFPIRAADSWMAEPLEPRVLFAATGLIAAGDLVARLTDAPANLSAPRTFIVAATVGKLSLFAGGVPTYSGGIDHPTTTVDIYNSATGAWSVSHTPDPIGGGAATTLGNKAIFTTGVLSKRVEIFNAANGKWSTASLPVAAIWKTAATVGSQVILSGKDDTNQYYLAIFNARTGKWRAIMPPAPMQPSFTSARAAGKLLYNDFTKNAFDIYDPQSGLWSTTQQPRVAGLDYGIGLSLMRATTIGSKAIFRMDGGAAIYDGISGIWSSIQYADAGVIPFEGTVLALGSKLLFAGALQRGDVAVVDLANGLVSRAPMTNPYNWSAGAIVGTHALFAGGTTGDNIIAGPPISTFDLVDNYTDLSPSPVLSGGLTGTPGHRDQVTVINTGDAALPAGYTIQLYATPDRTLGGAILLGSRTVSSSLAAGASSPFNIRTVIPKDMPAGSYHLLAAVQDSCGNITPIAVEDGTFRVPGPNVGPATSHATLPAIKVS
jgi:hypothetical protein